MPAAEAIQATLSPVFLITGIGIFLDFIQGRLFRVMNNLRDTKPAPGEELTDEEVKTLIRQKQMLLKRGHLLRNAIAFGVVALALTAFTAALILASTFLTPIPDFLTLGVLSLALLSFLGSLAYALRDTFYSVKVVRREVAESIRDLAD